MKTAILATVYFLTFAAAPFVAGYSAASLALIVANF